MPPAAPARAGNNGMPDSPDPRLFYRCHVFCCTNERAPGHERGSCKQRGAEPLREYMKRAAKQRGIPNVRINASGCLDRCEFGPVMVVYPEGVWYAYRSREDIDEILDRHILGGGRVERLMLQPEQVPEPAPAALRHG